jgi:hypothetical protein
MARIVLNRKGVQELLTHPNVVADLEDRAKKIAAAAGAGMESEAQAGRKRALALVWTGTREAREAEATSRALTRAIDAGRG